MPERPPKPRVFKSFGDLPSMQRPRPFSNKVAEQLEDQARLGSGNNDDEMEQYAGAYAPVENAQLSSSTLRSLQDRLRYYEESTVEDPKIKELQIRQLRARIQEEKRKLAEGDSVPMHTAPQSSVQPKKTGWWNIIAQEETAAGEVVQNSVTESQQAQKDIDSDRMNAQMTRLTKLTKKLRENTGVSHRDALKENETYAHARSEIRRIRARLKHIEEKKDTETTRAEIAQLRHELAEHLLVLRREDKELRERISQAHAPESPVQQPETNTSAGQLDPEDAADGESWDQLGALMDQAAQKTPEPSETIHTETTLTESAEIQQTEQEPKDYERRLELRNDWKEKKSRFDVAYRSYLESVKVKQEQRTFIDGLTFWKRDHKPQELIQMEEAYQEARKTYAASLSKALSSRIDTVDASEDAREAQYAFRAALANRFVIAAAHDRLQAEKEFVPTVKGARVYEKLSEAFRKHGRTIKIVGYAAVGGVALASGGVAAAVFALAGRAVQTKVTAGLIAGGVTVGALGGNMLSDAIIDRRAEHRDNAYARARRSFSIESLDALESRYLQTYRSHESAVRNKSKFIAGGALIGGLAGAVAAGSIESVGDLPIPETPPETEPELPPVVTPEPEPIPVPEPEPEPIIEFEPEVEFEVPAPIPEYVPDVEEGPDDFVEEVGTVEPVLHTFEAGSSVDTVSEALFEAWKDDPEMLDESLSKNEFLAQMYSAIAEIEADPEANAALMEQMGIESGDIDKVAVGQTINLQPFFEYLKARE